MTSLKILTTAAAIALLLPQAVPTASFAQNGGKPAAGFHGGPGGGGFVARGGGGGVRAGGGGYRGGGFHGGHDHGYRSGGFLPGAAIAGAVIGSAIAADAYGGPAYYDPGPQYYDDSVAADPGDAVGYCQQTYRSYDPASGTYLGYDGLRHPRP